MHAVTRGQPRADPLPAERVSTRICSHLFTCLLHVSHMGLHKSHSEVTVTLTPAEEKPPQGELALSRALPLFSPEEMSKVGRLQDHFQAQVGQTKLEVEKPRTEFSPPSSSHSPFLLLLAASPPSRR